MSCINHTCTNIITFTLFFIYIYFIMKINRTKIHKNKMFISSHRQSTSQLSAECTEQLHYHSRSTSHSPFPFHIWIKAVHSQNFSGWICARPPHRLRGWREHFYLHDNTWHTCMTPANVNTFNYTTVHDTPAWHLPTWTPTNTEDRSIPWHFSFVSGCECYRCILASGLVF